MLYEQWTVCNGHVVTICLYLSPTSRLNPLSHSYDSVRIVRLDSGSIRTISILEADSVCRGDAWNAADWLSRYTIILKWHYRRQRNYGHYSTQKVVAFRAYMPDDRLMKTALVGSVDGIRQRGRPLKKWIDNITDWTDLTLCEAVWLS